MRSSRQNNIYIPDTSIQFERSGGAVNVCDSVRAIFASVQVMHQTEEEVVCQTDTCVTNALLKPTNALLKPILLM